jgi:hypothetical protein
MSDRPPVRHLVLVPAILTLAVTLLRLFGELQRWDPRFFNREAGGPGSLIGIVWLVPVFGAYFGIKLAQGGHGPAGKGRAIVTAVGSLLLFAAILASTFVLKLPGAAQLLVIAAASPVLAWLVYRGWPALGRTLIAYALAARIPVAIVMLIAIHAGWGTHYELGAPGTPEMGPWAKWFWIGLVPQMTFWVAFTVVVGAVFGSIAAALTRPRTAT